MTTIRLPTPSDPDIRRVLDRQALVMFELADDVLTGLPLDECLSKPSEESWTVHQRDGRWFGELHDEPPGLPTPSLGWTMWHPIWWLRVLLAHAHDEAVPSPEAVEWPGPSSSIPTTRRLWAEWIAFLDGMSDDELRSGRHTKFPYEDQRPFVYIAGWASMELTKNLSEMCLQRRLVTNSRAQSGRPTTPP